MDSSTSENSSEDEDVKKCGKPEKWARNKKKSRRAQEKGYVNARKTKTVPPIKFQLVTRCCPKKCCQHFPYHSQKTLFEKFRDTDKENQDTYLMSCVESVEIKRAEHLPKSKNRDFSWLYSINDGSVKKRSCKKFLLSLYQITNKRMRTVLKFCKEKKIKATENRGKHFNRPNRISVDVCKMIEEHWSLIPHKKSHYCRKKTERKYFSNPNLSVRVLYALFKDHYFEKKKKKLEMSYSAYFKYFKAKSTYSFRSPRTDVCDFCTKCELKLRANPQDECKAAYLEHLQKVEDYKKLKETYVPKKNEASPSDNQGTLIIIEFDYAQNLSVPKLNVNSHYYKRHLNMYVFNTHSFQCNTSKMYCFLENEGSKNADSVCSFIHNFIETQTSKNKNVKEIVMFSDSAGGQNKNLQVVKYCTWLAQRMKVRITHIFPPRGHTYCQCDRNFGLYGSILKKIEIVSSPNEYLEIMRSARKTSSPFIAELSSNLLQNWNVSLNTQFGKTQKPALKGYTFSIQKYVKLLYTPNNQVSAYTGYYSSPINFKYAPKQQSPFKLSPISKLGISK